MALLAGTPERLRELGLELTVLGAGCALPQKGRGPAGYAVRGDQLEGALLFDCGPGTIRSLADYEIELLDITCVVISHFHIDHILDLFALAFARRNPKLEGESLPELRVIGPKGLRALLESMPPSMQVLREGSLTTCIEVDLDRNGEGAVAIPGASLRCSRAFHVEESLSWRLDSAGKSLVYSGDTGETAALSGLAAGADVLITECALSGAEKPLRHLNGRTAGQIAQAAGVSRLVLSHFYPHVSPAHEADEAAKVFGGEVLIAVDGTRLGF